MPTVPPQCIPRARLEDQDIVHSVLSSQIALGTSPGASGPTPDTDYDDMILVPVAAGDVGAVSSVSQDNLPEHVNSEQPRLNLSEIALHSPSSILGTPFDISSPRFEYPFPISEPEPISSMTPMPPLPIAPTIPTMSNIPTIPSIPSISGIPPVPTITSPLSHFSASFLPPAAPISLSNPLPLSRPVTTTASVNVNVNVNSNSGTGMTTTTTHLKLQAKVSKEPPVPPGLAGKRWAMGTNITINTGTLSTVIPLPNPLPPLPPLKSTTTSASAPNRPRTRQRSSSEVIPQAVENLRSVYGTGVGNRSMSVERSLPRKTNDERGENQVPR